MFPVYRVIGNGLSIAASESRNAIWNFGRVAQLAGVTTATDLVNDFSAEGNRNLHEITGDPAYPLRIVPAFAPQRSPEGGPERVLAAMTENTDKLRFGPVKFIVDGSIQGFTARLKWPGYLNGKPNGLWLIPPSQFVEVFTPFHLAGLQLHIHTNGDEATELVLDAIEKILDRYPRHDHRHTLQHCQMADAAQLARAARLGMCINFFANHLYYWGDAHYSQTMGADRANRMNPAESARRLGIAFAMHSDAPITPLNPLFTAWCAAARQSSTGRVLGASERLPVEHALRAITLGAAYTLKMDASGRQHRSGQVRRLRRAARRPRRGAARPSEGPGSLGHGARRPGVPVAGVMTVAASAPQRPPIAPIALIVLGGYLGAGKTTLLNRLLADAQGRRVTVLVNDFGAINIDASLIREQSDDVISLENGCVCCSIGGRLVQALVEISARADPPDVLIIEASGVSDPVRIAQVGMLDRAFRLHGDRRRGGCARHRRNARRSLRRRYRAQADRRRDRARADQNRPDRRKREGRGHQQAAGAGRDAHRDRSDARRDSARARIRRHSGRHPATERASLAERNTCASSRRITQLHLPQRGTPEPRKAQGSASRARPAAFAGKGLRSSRRRRGAAGTARRRPADSPGRVQRRGIG